MKRIKISIIGNAAELISIYQIIAIVVMIEGIYLIDVEKTPI
jgi:hypothetical protein